MIIPYMPELSLLGVADPNIPNKERIVIKTQENISLSDYGIIVGYKNDQDIVIPLREHYFWFGNIEIEASSWLVVYSGPGQFQRTRLSETLELAYTLHWGKQYTVFSDPNLVPIIIKMSTILIGESVKSITR